MSVLIRIDAITNGDCDSNATDACDAKSCADVSSYHNGVRVIVGVAAAAIVCCGLAAHTIGTVALGQTTSLGRSLGACSPCLTSTEARDWLHKNGFGEINSLRQVSRGIWIASTSSNGKLVTVGVDQRGNIGVFESEAAAEQAFGANGQGVQRRR